MSVVIEFKKSFADHSEDDTSFEVTTADPLRATPLLVQGVQLCHKPQLNDKDLAIYQVFLSMPEASTICLQTVNEPKARFIMHLDGEWPSRPSMTPQTTNTIQSTQKIKRVVTDAKGKKHCHLFSNFLAADANDPMLTALFHSEQISMLRMGLYNKRVTYTKTLSANL